MFINKAYIKFKIDLFIPLKGGENPITSLFRLAKYRVTNSRDKLKGSVKNLTLLTKNKFVEESTRFKAQNPIVCRKSQIIAGGVLEMGTILLKPDKYQNFDPTIFSAIFLFANVKKHVLSQKNHGKKCELYTPEIKSDGTFTFDNLVISDKKVLSKKQKIKLVGQFLVSALAVGAGITKVISMGEPYMQAVLPGIKFATATFALALEGPLALIDIFQIVRYSRKIMHRRSLIKKLQQSPPVDEAEKNILLSQLKEKLSIAKKWEHSSIKQHIMTLEKIDFERENSIDEVVKGLQKEQKKQKIKLAKQIIFLACRLTLITLSILAIAGTQGGALIPLGIAAVAIIILTANAHKFKSLRGVVQKVHNQLKSPFQIEHGTLWQGPE